MRVGCFSIFTGHFLVPLFYTNIFWINLIDGNVFRLTQTSNILYFYAAHKYAASDFPFWQFYLLMVDPVPG